MRGLFVTATDTDVGKTWLSSLIVKQLVADGHRVGAYKPACSGSVGEHGTARWHDIDVLTAALGQDGLDHRVCPQRFHAPLAPPEAAAREGAAVDADLLRTGARWWRDHADVLITEGVGGLLCPLTDAETIADLAADLGNPLLLVARSGLGTINHTLLTIDAARTRDLTIAGIVLNDATGAANPEQTQANARWITRFADLPVTACCRQNEDVLRSISTGEVIRPDWFSLAACAE